MYGHGDSLIASSFRWGRMEGGDEEKLDAAFLSDDNDATGGEGDGPGTHKNGEGFQASRRFSTVAGPLKSQRWRRIAAVVKTYAASSSSYAARRIGMRSWGAAIAGELWALPSAAAQVSPTRHGRRHSAHESSGHAHGRR